MEKKENWVQAWGMSHIHLSLMSFFSGRRTLRLVLNSAISGEGARLRLCNRYSGSAVAIGRAAVAPCDENGAISDPSGIRRITFGGKEGMTLPPGATVVSDEAALAIPAGSCVCVSLHIKKGRLQSGNYINNARLFYAGGDHCEAPAMRHKKRPRQAIINIAGRLLGMRLNSPIPLFQAVELRNADGASSIDCFGDSLTQQGFWSNIFDARIRGMYPGRYSVINKAIGGNRILRDTSGRFPLRGFFGIKALDRVQDDIFDYEGISHVVFCLGTNDYYQPNTLAGRKNEFASAEEIAAGTTKLAEMIRAHGITVVGLNFVPTGLGPDSRPAKNVLRRELNEWFEGCGLFDFSFDISTPFTSAENTDLPPRSYVGGDKLHPNEEGGRVMADAIDLGVFGS